MLTLPTENLIKNIKQWLTYGLIAILISVQITTSWAGGLPTGTVPNKPDTSGEVNFPISVPLKTCPDPGICFVNEESKAKWAKQNNCHFKEICEDLEKVDYKNPISTTLAKVRFTEGLVAGLIEQLKDLWQFVKEVFANPGEVWEGVKTLAKLIIEDPDAALQIFVSLLGDDAYKLLKCGAYDQGHVIGKYVSPFFVFKVVNIVSKGGKLADAVNKVRKVILSASEKLKLGIKFLPNVKMPNGASWFDEIDIKKRGVGVENALGNNTPDTFPVVDIIDKSTGIVTSIKSKTPNSAYWTKPFGLRDSIKADIRKLADFTEDGKPAKGTWEKGTPDAGSEIKIEKDEISSKVLSVAVKKGTLTEDHYAQIRQAQVYADKLVAEGRSSKPIKIVIVEIP